MSGKQNSVILQIVVMTEELQEDRANFDLIYIYRDSNQIDQFSSTTLMVTS